MARPACNATLCRMDPTLFGEEQSVSLQFATPTVASATMLLYLLTSGLREPRPKALEQGLQPVEAASESMGSSPFSSMASRPSPSPKMMPLEKPV